MKLTAYLGVTGLVVRETAQFVVGFGPEGDPLAGRRIPRWLPPGPAFGVSGALLSYFGVTGFQLLLEQGSAAAVSGYDNAFLGLAVGAYLAWAPVWESLP